MEEYEAEGVTTFEVRAEVQLDATPDEVYAVVSDLPRCGQWSEECTGGAWISGEPAAVGSVFRGTNFRLPDPVAWAPVIRGDWTTDAEVVEAVPGKAFRWVILSSAGERQESTWSYEIEPRDGGTRLVHHYRLGRLTEGLSKIFRAGLDVDGRRRFVKEWNAKLAVDVEHTLERLKKVVEQH
ncbi:SRPBCC family protein [Lentzea sp. NPDC055074]